MFFGNLLMYWWKNLMWYFSIPSSTDLILYWNLRLSFGFSNIIYLFLYFQNSATKIERKQLQLVDVAVMFIASTFDHMEEDKIIVETWNSTLAHYLHLWCNLGDRQKLADLLLTTQQGPSFPIKSKCDLTILF